MRMWTILPLAVVGILLVVACSKREAPATGPATNEYTLKIKRTAGLKLDLLLITKPTADSIERESAEVTVPFSKDFKAVNYAAWIDAELKGQEGNYKMTVLTDGKPGSYVAGEVREGVKDSGLLNNL